MKKNILIIMLSLASCSIIAMEQPSPLEMQQAFVRYQTQRNPIIQPYIGPLTTEETKESKFDSLIDERETVVNSLKRLAINEGMWSIAYATLAVISGIVSLDNFSFGSSLNEIGTCLICGVSIASTLCSCSSCCDMCAACDLKNMNKDILKRYLEIKELKPIKVIVKEHYE